MSMKTVLLLAALILAMLLLIGQREYPKERQCKEAGGVMVSTAWGYTCVERLKR